MLNFGGKTPFGKPAEEWPDGGLQTWTPRLFLLEGTWGLQVWKGPPCLCLSRAEHFWRARSPWPGRMGDCRQGRAEARELFAILPFPTASLTDSGRVRSGTSPQFHISGILPVLQKWLTLARLPVWGPWVTPSQTAQSPRLPVWGAWATPSQTAQESLRPGPGSDRPCLRVRSGLSSRRDQDRGPPDPWSRS